ncbi:hypothetical protein F2P81_012740 [Scophthalmus maximus]|uniref:Uncharacterized protein n=1 Tax=Scophthalmus maximus TaxID=52904 RepID=A0A6A4SY93_SCOMX|nr:hypothetical protein F2P81_012740 [Scophthalmus maximus]
MSEKASRIPESPVHQTSRVFVERSCESTEVPRAPDNTGAVMRRHHYTIRIIIWICTTLYKPIDRNTIICLTTALMEGLWCLKCIIRAGQCRSVPDVAAERHEPKTSTNLLNNDLCNHDDARRARFGILFANYVCNVPKAWSPVNEFGPN